MNGVIVFTFAVILVLCCAFLYAGEKADQVPTYLKMPPGEYAGPRQVLAAKNLTHKQYVTAKYEGHLSAWKCTVAEDESLSIKAFLKGKLIDLNLARTPGPDLKWAQPLDDGVTACAIGGYWTPGIYVVTTWFEQAGKVLSGERCFVGAVADTQESHQVAPERG